MLVEIFRFELRSSADAASFALADTALQHAVSPLPGFMRRTTARSDGQWVVVSLWDSAELADAAPALPEWSAFEAFVEPGSIDRRRYTTLD